MIRFACPFCSKRLRAEPADAGESLDCPRCGKPVTVPAPPAPLADAPRRRLLTVRRLVWGPALAALVTLVVVILRAARDEPLGVVLASPFMILPFVAVFSVAHALERLLDG